MTPARSDPQRGVGLDQQRFHTGPGGPCFQALLRAQLPGSPVGAVDSRHLTGRLTPSHAISQVDSRHLTGRLTLSHAISQVDSRHLTPSHAISQVDSQVLVVWSGVNGLPDIVVSSEGQDPSPTAGPNGGAVQRVTR
ncbi:hypothetical protein JZ751_005654 [Albula glossodonta]|uniref:Uncharacterized protein n=1 Tax=Albula glossodonta TaxID=121402 RepID=A0A8T2MMY1_9TELE|nr:hypothetical protein JZ751_005654 [Albula glossodonta]